MVVLIKKWRFLATGKWKILQHHDCLCSACLRLPIKDPSMQMFIPLCNKYYIPISVAKCVCKPAAELVNPMYFSWYRHYVFNASHPFLMVKPTPWASDFGQFLPRPAQTSWVFRFESSPLLKGFERLFQSGSSACSMIRLPISPD